GSQISYHPRIRLPPGTDVAAYAEDLRDRFPAAGWRIREFSDAAPSLERMVRRLTVFLTLVGLTALRVGGVGVGNAVKAYLDGRLPTIATLKGLGASGRLIFQTYFAQILILAVIGIAAGLAIGATAPLIVNRIVSDLLPVDARIGLYPMALIVAAGFGILTAITFSLWPLARAREISAADLFRDVVAPTRRSPRAAFVAATAAGAAGLGALAIATADEKLFAAWFVVGSAATILVFRAAASLVVAGARRLRRPRRPGPRLALANLCRPGAPTGSVVLSLGLGLTVLVAIALIEGNMSRQINESLPEEAPAFFFIDIQREQMQPFAELMGDTPGAGSLDRVPSLRGRIAQINGVPAQEALVNPEHGWVLRGDRGVTFSAEARADYQILEGAWWPADYDGPTLVSIYRDVADAFAIGIGDRLAVNVLGRTFEAEIANIREIDWGSMSINFVLVFSPTPLNAAPHTFLATVQATPEAELAVQRAVTTEFPNVTTVRVREALETVNDIMRKIGTAVRATAGITLFAGTLVLAGAIAAGHRRRVYDSVVLKVLGATRATVLRAFAIEYGLLGLVTAAIAALVGTIAAWAVLTWVMEVDWVFLPGAVVGTTLLCAGITIAFGFLGTWRALGQKAAPLLRNE
ncbi:MAG: FtsX-like permease family protein, partial [Inquilinus sp.]|nr:FtsX-like permease family protein [Inquilinus sp.]